MPKSLRISLYALAPLAVLTVAVAIYVLGTRHGQDLAFRNAAQAIFANAIQPPRPFDGLRAFVCGSGSPLPGRAQACIAITAGESLYVVDVGGGSPGMLQAYGESLAPLKAVLITHNHSDHITGLPDLNLASWVGGRSAPLTVMGPSGIEAVVDGFNLAFSPDRGFRTTHHGADMLVPEVGPMRWLVIEPGVVIEDDGLAITAFLVDHTPVEPAFGYRFDYRGRSVVVSGDTIVTPGLEAAAKGADLLIQDVLSRRIINALEEAATAAGALRQAKIMKDVPEYHAGAADLAGLAERAGVGTLAVYHYVPPPTNYLMERMYRTDLASDAVLTEDGMAFELPAGSTTTKVLYP